MQLYVIRICCLWIFVRAKLNPLSSQDIAVRKSITECVVEASKRFFKISHETVTISLPTEEANNTSPISLEQLLLPALGNAINTDFLIKDMNYPTHNIPKKTYIGLIHFRSLDDYVKQIRLFKANKLLNEHGKFLIVSTIKYKRPLRIAAFVAKFLWNENVVNSVIMLPNYKESHQIGVFTWYPYANSKCGRKLSREVKLLEYCTFGNISSEVSWFAGKIPDKFSECILNVHYLDWAPYSIHSNDTGPTGVEVQLLNLVADKLNLRMNYTKTNFRDQGDVLENKTLAGVFIPLNKKVFDIVIGGYPKLHNIATEFETTQPYMQDYLIFCVPLLIENRNLHQFINLTTTGIRIATFVLVTTVTLLMWFWGRLSMKEQRSYRSLYYITMNVFTVCIGAPPRFLPRTFRVRLVMAMFMSFSYITNVIVNSIITSSLSRPSIQYKYASITDIYKNSLNTYFFPRDQKFFQYGIREDSTISFDVIKSKWMNCRDVDTCLRKVSTNKDSAVCLRNTLVVYLKKVEKLNDIHCIKYPIVRYPVSMVMRKGFPIFNRIDEILLRLIERGFISKFISEFVRNPDHKDIDFARSRKIQAESLAPIFQLFGQILIVSAIVFLLEILFHKKRKRISIIAM